MLHRFLYYLLTIILPRVIDYNNLSPVLWLSETEIHFLLVSIYPTIFFLHHVSFCHYETTRFSLFYIHHYTLLIMLSLKIVHLGALYITPLSFSPTTLFYIIIYSVTLLFINKSLWSIIYFHICISNIYTYALAA